MSEPTRDMASPSGIAKLLKRVVPGRTLRDTFDVERLASNEPWARQPLEPDAAATIDRETEERFLTFVSLWGRQFPTALRDTQTVLRLLSDRSREAIAMRLVEEQKVGYRARSPEQSEGLARIGIHSEDDVGLLIRPSTVAETAAHLLPAVVFGLYPERKPRPRRLSCRFCGTVFVDLAQPQWLVRWSGPPRYCTPCLQRIHHLDVRVKPPFRKQELVEGLQHLSAALGGPPPMTLIGRDAQSGRPLHRAEDPRRRDRIAEALIAVPRFPRFATKFRTADWLDVLEAAGIIDGAIRRARGTSVRASDGTWMRSLSEKHVDDYLSSAGIAHEHEPAWPPHPTLNPSGRRRADWRLEDGTFVEYAGLAGDAAYDKKIQEKILLADALGIPLIVLTEPDLLRLSTLIPGPHEHAPLEGPPSI